MNLKMNLGGFGSPCVSAVRSGGRDYEGALPRCTSCSPHRSRSGTARSWSSASQGAEAVRASCGRRGHRADSRRSWVRRRQVRHTHTLSDAFGRTADGSFH